MLAPVPNLTPTPDNRPGYDVFTIAGQSNTYNGRPNASDGAVDPVLDATNANILQLGRWSPNTNTAIVASEPLEHNDTNLQSGQSLDDRIAWGMTFAKWWRHTYQPVQRKVLLVPCGQGSTGFSDDFWDEGGTGYADAVARTNTAMGLGSGYNVYRGFLWHQGEEDAVAGWTAAQYKTAWKAMMTAFSTDISQSNFPIVVGGLLPYGVDNLTGYDVIDGALRDLPSEVAYVGFADPDSPTTLENEVNPTSNHFSARSMRGYPTHDFDDVTTLGFAGRYATAYQTALSNL